MSDNTTQDKSSAKKEIPQTVKAFRSSSDVADFYRFIFENGLRDEAHKLTKVVLAKITPQKKRGRKKILQ